MPEEALLDARGRALVDMHMKLCDLLLTRHAGTIVFPKRLLPKEKWNRAQRRRSRSTWRYSTSILSATALPPDN